MLFMWSFMLWPLLLVPFVIALYFILLPRRKSFALRYSSLSLIREAAGKSSRIRRHLAPFLFLLALIAILIGSARPVALVTLPSQEGVIMLAMDVSGSMGAADLEPNRMAAAQEAAIAFVNQVPATISIGVVSFNESAALVQQPTLNRQDVVKAIERLTPTTGTAIGSGLDTALAAIYELSGQKFLSASASNGNGQAAMLSGQQVDVPSAIVLLTDGENTSGPLPIEVAQVAAQRGIPLHTVGIGKPEGAIVERDGQSIHTSLDADLLQAIAKKTRGTFSVASTASDLRAVYESLSTRLVLKADQTEITVVLLGVAGMLSLLAAMLSVFWFGRLI